jgi:hypothetical protein
MKMQRAGLSLPKDSKLVTETEVHSGGSSEVSAGLLTGCCQQADACPGRQAGSRVHRPAGTCSAQVQAVPLFQEATALW